MYSVHDWAEVHRLHHVEGLDKAAIAVRLGMSRTTVHRLAALDEPPRYVRASGPGKPATFTGAVAAMLEAFGVTEANWHDATERVPHFAISESPAFVGRAVVALAADPGVARWNGESLSSGQLARHYGFTDLDGSQPDAWRYVPEVQDAGRPADTTGYR